MEQGGRATSKVGQGGWDMDEEPPAQKIPEGAQGIKPLYHESTFDAKKKSALSMIQSSFFVRYCRRRWVQVKMQIIYSVKHEQTIE